MRNATFTRIWEYLEIRARELPDSPMWFYENSYLSYGKVNQQVDHIASGLLARGYTPGDKLGILANNQPEWLVTYLAALKIGVTLVSLSVRYRDEELIYMLNQSQARGIVCVSDSGDIDYAAYLDSLKRDIPNLSDIILIGSDRHQHTGFNELLATPIDTEKLKAVQATVCGDTPSIIIYTSGTTGRPKGALLTHRSQLTSALAQTHHLNMTADDVLPIIAPLNHVGGVTCGALASLVAGSCALLVPKFSPMAVIELLKRCPVTIMAAVPTMYTLLMQHPEFNRLDNARVRVLQVGGSNADEALINSMRDHYPGVSILNNYGMTEVSGFVLMSRFNESDDIITTSVGIPIGDTEIKVVDGAGDTLANGEIGELCIRGNSVITEYYRLPEVSAECKTTDGWFFSGDIGLIDKVGRVHLKGRKKEMFLQGSFNVYPLEIENILTQHPEVIMAAGIGVPDSILGEVGKYFIIRSPQSTLSEKALLEYCKARMANYKVPREIVFCDELPMTPAGKIMKSKLS